MHSNAISGNSFIESAAIHDADGIEVRVVTWPGLLCRCCAVSIVFMYLLWYQSCMQVIHSATVLGIFCHNSAIHHFLHFNWVSRNQEQAIWTGLNSCATVAAMSCRSVSPRISAANHYERTYENLWNISFPFSLVVLQWVKRRAYSLPLLPNLKEVLILFVEVPLSLCRCRTSSSLCSELGDVPTVCSKDSGAENAHVLGSMLQTHTHTHTSASKFDRLYRIIYIYIDYRLYLYI